jgi:hypothetical protein
MEDDIDLNHALPEAEEQELERRVRWKYRVTMGLVFGLPALAIVLLAGYVVHLLVMAV